MFRREYGEVFKGDEEWRGIPIGEGNTYNWSDDSTYVKNPPYFTEIDKPLKAMSNVKDARVLAVFADSITTDHISPAGSIKPDSPAGKYLQENGVAVNDFNSYGSRRGNHEVMMRGTFANIRIKNQMLDNVEGGYTIHVPSGEQMSIYDAAMKYQKENTPLVVLAGKEYGTAQVVTGQQKAQPYWAYERSSLKVMSVFTAPTLSVWECCHCSLKTSKVWKHKA